MKGGEATKMGKCYYIINSLGGYSIEYQNEKGETNSIKERGTVCTFPLLREAKLKAEWLSLVCHGFNESVPVIIKKIL